MTELPEFDLDSYRDKGYLTHSIHPYPAKFVPQIPRALIEKLSHPGALVLDPFCGSGTTLLEAMLLGRRALGSDLNGLAVMIARAKTAILTTDSQRYLAEFVRRVEAFADLPSLRPTMGDAPHFKNRDHWFSEESVRDLTQIRNAIAGVPDQVLREYLSVCFSAIVVKSSRQENDTNWRAIDRKYATGDAHRFFAKRARDNLARSRELGALVGQASSAVVTETDARKLWIPAESVDLIVTSPPYANSYDYYLYHKLRLFWLGIDHYPIQADELGSRNKHSDLSLPLESFVAPMIEIFSALAASLRKGAAMAVVVGDSVLAGEVVDMATVYDRIAIAANLVRVDHFTFDQRRYSRAFTANQQRHNKKSHILLYRRSI